jgi:hypothetical protein
MHVGGREIVAILTGASFAAGLNVYATLATLGLLARAEVVTLPPGLHVVESWWVIAAAIVLFVIEFFGDKIPAFDLVWNALHTFIRVPIAALLAYGATTQLSPMERLSAAALGGGIALAAHGGKTAARALVTPSPEPLSNIGLSLGEDVFAIFLTWFATQHPYVTAAVVGVLVLVILLAIRFVWRALRRLFVGAEQKLVHSESAV